MDPGAKSEGEEEMGASGSGQHGIITTINVHNPNNSIKHHVIKSGTLGRTPNHLTLSTTSTLSVGSTGSQARLIQSSHAPSMYQPVMMKDLGKDQKDDLSSSSDNCDSDNNSSAMKTATGKGTEDTGGYAAIDRHLNAFNMAENANIVDYMQNLKVKHLEIQLSEEKQDATETDKDASGDVAKEEGETDTGTASSAVRVEGEKSGADKKATAADKPKGSVTKSQKERHNETQKSEKLILNIDTSEMDMSTSPIKIIKIKSRSRSVSPRRPSIGDGSKSPKGKGTTGDETPVLLAKTHGILKRSSSSKSMETPDLLSTPTGILKRSLSPKDLAKLDGLSPRNSFDSRASPVRSPQSDYCHSPFSQTPNTVIDNRSPIVVVRHKGRSATKTTSRARSVSASASVCNSLDSESSMGPSAKKKRSLSTSNFDQNQMSSMDSEMSLLSPSYYYNRSCFSSAASLTSNGGNNSFDNDLSSLHNSHERIMYDNPIVIHSHDYRRRRSQSPGGNEAILTKAIEQPTCMECFLQSRKVS